MTSARSIGLALALAALVGCGGSSDRGEPDADVTPDQLVLQLSDLPGGYAVGDDSSCDAAAPATDPIGIEGAGPRLRDLVLKERPVGCNMQLERQYDGGASAPPRVESMALRFESEEGAEAGFEIADEIVAYVTGEDDLRPSTLKATLGDDARAFSSDDVLVEGEIGQPGIAVVWRSGSVLAAVLTGGLGEEAGERATLALAERQQERIESPTPIQPAEQDDREVALDNPGLDIDVYWLGRSFSPGGGLPELRLYEASGPYGPGESPGNVVKIDYTRGVNVDLWERATWERFLRTRLGRLVWDSPCARADRLGLPDGHAVIYSGYARRVPLPQATPRPSSGGDRSAPPPTHTPPCPDRPFDRYLAHVYFRDVVVSVNLPYCYACARRPNGARDPYNSRAGMEAIVRGLQLRPTGGT